VRPQTCIRCTDNGRPCTGLPGQSCDWCSIQKKRCDLPGEKRKKRDESPESEESDGIGPSGPTKRLKRADKGKWREDVEEGGEVSEAVAAIAQGFAALSRALKKKGL
jgi:hypothetical protein